MISYERVDLLADQAQQFGELALGLARIDRATTLGPDGVPESDTDHTVSVGLVAVELAQRLDPKLDIGKIAILSLVHDTLEDEAGDTQTFYPDEELLVGKAEREAQGRQRFEVRFGKDSWLLRYIDEYEEGETVEASFVQLVDKLVRSVSHIHDGGRSLRERGMTREQHDRNVTKTYERMSGQMERHPTLTAVWQRLDERVCDLL
jgi:5'-deoxynucleotidase YfbR-like HD superfamily hydrolase